MEKLSSCQKPSARQLLRVTLIDIRTVAEKISRAPSMSACRVARIIEAAGFHRQTAATDAAVELVAQPGHFFDPGIEMRPEVPADPGPIRLGRRSPFRQFLKLPCDFGNRKAKFLGHKSKREAPDISSQESSLTTAIADGRDQSLGFIKPDRRDRQDPCAQQVLR